MVHCAGHHFDAMKVFYICLLHRKSSTKHQRRDVFMQFSSEFRFCSRKWRLLSLQFQVKPNVNTFLSIWVLAYSGIKIAKDVHFSIAKAFEIIKAPRLTFFTNVPKTSRKTTLCWKKSLHIPNVRMVINILTHSIFKQWSACPTATNPPLDYCFPWVVLLSKGTRIGDFAGDSGVFHLKWSTSSLTLFSSCWRSHAYSIIILLGGQRLSSRSTPSGFGKGRPSQLHPERDDATAPENQDAFSAS